MEVFVVVVVILNDLVVLHKVGKSGVVFVIVSVVSLELTDEATEHLLYVGLINLVLDSNSFNRDTEEDENGTNVREFHRFCRLVVTKF